MRLLSGFFLVLILFCSSFARETPRVIVLTDISNEPDDEQSMVRFLVYSNQYDVEGLIATTSVWLQDTTRADLIHRQIDAYEQVRPNLLVHEPDFPPADALRAVIRTGQTGFGMQAVGAGLSSPGSDHIIEIVDRADERPVWISVWGGTNTLAQALWDVRRNRSEQELEAFVSKLRVYTIGDQDDAGRWLRLSFPDLYYIVSPTSVHWREYYTCTWTGIAGDLHYQNGPMHHFELVDNPWLTEHIIKHHGPLGALYPRVEYIMEGDTPSFLNLIDNGLGSHIDPSYGGWGGRYELYQSYAEIRPIYTNARDTYTAENGITSTSAQATIWRWRQAYQHDFAARMDWCITSDYTQANHNPNAVIDGDGGTDVLRIETAGGQTVRLSAQGSFDPDQDDMDISWFVYPEAGTMDLQLTDDTGFQTSFVAPHPDVEDTEVHVILQVKDYGEPNLFSYRRAIVIIRK